jgi:hypothetical protein
MFCVEDRALLYHDCDEPIHVPGTLSGNHERFHLRHRRGQPPTQGKLQAPVVQEVSSSPFLLPSGWAVEDLLQLSDHESSVGPSFTGDTGDEQGASPRELHEAQGERWTARGAGR